MSTPIARPTFYEGEVLPAADLTATVDYSRNQMARHTRYAHSWGIVIGLELTPDYQVTAGVAIDGTGREVVVPANTPLPAFAGTTIASDPKALYPVFLNGVDKPASPSSNLTGACSGGQSTSTQDWYAITFGATGSELQIAGQTLPAFTDGPDDGSTQVWRILLGFVTYQSPNFTSVANSNPATGIGRRYVGVNAAQVVSTSGSLLLATDPATSAASSSVMAVELQESKGQLVFGKLGTNGTVTPAVTLTATGDVIATGKVSGSSIPVSLQVQSGIAFDGMILPLPLGVDPSSSTQIYMQVSPRIDPNLPPPSGMTNPIAFPYECTVDAATRRVSCRVNWWDAANWLQTNVVVAPSPCDYLVIAASGAS
jgi:hypothetical protein